MTDEERQANIEKDMKRQELTKQISELEKKLSDSHEYGDWKIIKCYEASLKKEELPYDLDKLMEQRQSVRDEINELQEELDNL
jgi:DNA-binding protein YbaB